MKLYSHKYHLVGNKSTLDKLLKEIESKGWEVSNHDEKGPIKGSIYKPNEKYGGGHYEDRHIQIGHVNFIETYWRM